MIIFILLNDAFMSYIYASIVQLSFKVMYVTTLFLSSRAPISKKIFFQEQFTFLAKCLRGNLISI